MRSPDCRPGCSRAARPRARRSPRAPRALLLTTSLALCFLSFPAAGRAADPCPLDGGRQWVYEDAAGTALTVTVAGTRSLRGRTATILRHEVASRRDDIVYELYCSLDGEGNLLLHGHWRRDTGEAALFDPPLLYVDVPLVPGKSWGGSSTQYADLEGSGPGLPIQYAYAVKEVEEVALPGGTFTAYRLGLAGSAMLDRWYSEGIGAVQLQPLVPLGRTFKLVEGSGPALVENRSWGHLKQTYR